MPLCFGFRFHSDRKCVSEILSFKIFLVFLFNEVERYGSKTIVPEEIRKF